MKTENYSDQVADMFNEHAQSYAERFADQSLYFEALHCFVKLLPEKATVVDLGSGPGNVAKELLTRTSKIKAYVAVDLAADMLALAAKIDPRVQPVCANVLDTTHYKNLLKQAGIVASFCAPYWKDEELNNWIQEISQYTDPNTVLYFSTMSDEIEKPGLKTNSHGQQLWMNFYSVKNLQALFAQHGWVIQNDFSIHNDERSEIIWILTNI
jgi:SAM-dependent methyltransferase